MLLVVWFSTRTLPIAVEEHAARRRQRQAAPVVVVGHLGELLVLRDLEDPERDRQQGKQPPGDDLHDRQALPEMTAIVGLQGGRHRIDSVRGAPGTTAR